MNSKINYVYILLCNDLTLYTGWTNDIESRINAHNAGNGAKYTKMRLPVTLVYKEVLETKSDALKRELEIKKLSRRKKLILIGKEEIEKRICKEWHNGEKYNWSSRFC